MTNIIKLTDDNFQETIKTFDASLVDFYADWCKPCKKLMPVLEKVAEETDIKVVKVNIEQNPITPSGLGVLAIPALFLFKEDKQVASRFGALTKTDILGWIKEELKDTS